MIKEKKDMFFREFNLIQERKSLSKKAPVSHQRQAIASLEKWFNKKHGTEVGSLVVLPTGGGKTFTAVRFLCSSPLSKGYKVLWLAHTHHLLEQAFYSFAPKQQVTNIKQQGSEVAYITEPKQKLSIRVVSGTPGHFSINQVKPTDDVLIVTLQTITSAYKNKVSQLKAFLESTEKLFIVFDEAHHSPSPTYAKFLTELRLTYPNTCLLGLTATPTYYNERKQGWLKKLFPQGIIYQVSIKKLMAEGILAKPNVESYKTEFEPNFDEREYQKWINTYQDLPENIITGLAENRERNAFIAKTYVENKERYKKTIIFAERWHQCDQLREFLRRYKIKADVIYSHVEHHSEVSKTKRSLDANTKALEAFRNNEIDVLINVRMLTEGTDVPDVNTVFLTRQTTSKVLLTQMVGRALRGPRFSGTEEANIVSFTDNWKKVINWAEYDQITDGMADESIPEYGKRLPLQLVSIAMVRTLIQQMNMGINVIPKPFVTLIPIGWYLIEFETSIKGSDDDSTVRQMVLVFQDNEKNYKEFINYLSQQNLDLFVDEDILLKDNEPTLTNWQKKFFSTVENHQEDELLRNLFHIARHMAQREKEEPKFFYFEERNNHDLDAVAQKFISDKLNRYQEKQALEGEYQRRDRYWTVIYPNFQYFYLQYNACADRFLDMPPQENITLLQPSNISHIESFSNKELSEELKTQVKTRDGYKCLCCNETSKRLLVIDHIAPSYYGGNNSLDNLQTLCKTCNQIKDISELNFRIHKKDSLIKPPNEFPNIDLPNAEKANDNLEWEKFLYRTFNVFYGCAAVSKITIGKRGKYFDEWQIELYDGNKLAWFEPHLTQLLENIYTTRKKVKPTNPNPTALRLLSPNQQSISINININIDIDIDKPSKTNKNNSLMNEIKETSPSNVTPTRALSIRQPYAEQILRGTKKKEFRSKVTHIRERVYIYASLTPGSTLDFKKMKLNPESLPTGVIVGTVEIVDCVGEDGDYEWHLANPQRLKENLKPKNKPQPMFFYPFG